MASTGNRHCANCIGTLSFPTRVSRKRYVNKIDTQRVAPVVVDSQAPQSTDVDNTVKELTVR